MRLNLLALFGLALVTISAPALSENKEPGETDASEFSLVVERWLNNEDLPALQGLAELSRHGNSSAQILLASIAARGNMHSHVTSKLDRKDRIALLRIPKGLSGKSWLTEAESEEPLATALLQSKRIGEKAPAIAALIELGEPQTALLAAQSMLFQGEADKLITALQGLDDQLPEDAAVLLFWALYQTKNNENSRYVGSSRIASAITGDERFEKSEMNWVPPTPWGILENTDRRDAVIRLSDKVEAWTPVRDFCEKTCPASASTCTAVGVSLLWGAGPFPMRSPLESVIPNAVYWSSPRIEGDLARSIPDLRQNREGKLDKVDACFVESMIAAQAVHGYGR